MRHYLALLICVMVLAGWAVCTWAQDETEPAPEAEESQENTTAAEPDTAPAAIPAAPVYYCPRAKSMIIIDGNVDDPAWDDAPWSDDFVDILGAQSPKPRYITSVKLLWDSEFLYIAAVLEEPRLQATLQERDAPLYQTDNDFEVFIDPDGDTQNYFELGVNALNTVYDQLMTRPYRDGGVALTGWDFKGFRSAVMLGGTMNDDADSDDGWLAELALPWSAMASAAGAAAPPGPGDYWRVNFNRVEWDFHYSFGGYVKQDDAATGDAKPESNWVWSPQGAVNMHMPERWGYVVFTDNGEGSWVNPPNMPVELARQSLYTLYHAERRYLEANGTYAWAASQLEGYSPVLSQQSAGGLIPPDEWAQAEIYIYPNGYCASQRLPSGQAVWIDHTGRSWLGQPVAGGPPSTPAEQP